MTIDKTVKEANRKAQGIVFKAAKQLVNKIKKPAVELGYLLDPSIEHQKGSEPGIMIYATYFSLVNTQQSWGSLGAQNRLSELIKKEYEYKGKTYKVEHVVLSNVSPSDYL